MWGASLALSGVELVIYLEFFGIIWSSIPSLILVSGESMEYLVLNWWYYLEMYGIVWCSIPMSGENLVLSGAELVVLSGVAWNCLEKVWSI